MKTFERDLMVVECVNISAWYKKVREDSNKFNGFSVQTLWALKKNMKKIDEIANNFEEFKSGLEDKLKEDYFNEEKSEPNKFVDQNGQEVEGRKIKEDFIEEYQTEVNKLNTQINEVLYSKETLNLNEINIDNEIENMGNNTNITIDDLDILSAFENEEEDA